MSYQRIPCYMCGKPIGGYYLDEYTYKETINKRLEYFCSWGCWRAWEKEKEEKKKKRKKQPAVNTTGKHCIDCRYCKEDEVGYKCTTYSQIANIERNACRRFREK